MANIVHMTEYPKLTHGDQKAAEDRFQIFHTESYSEVLSLTLANMSPTIDVDGTELVLQTFTPEHQGGGVWEVGVRYGERKSDGSTSDSGDAGTGATIQFEFGSGTTKITQALFTRQVVGLAGVNPKDVQGALGFDGEKVNGIDIQSSVFHWTETHRMAATEFTLEYMQAISDLCSPFPTTNLATFRGFEAEEVLFLGASGGSKDAGTLEVTFKFARQKGIYEIDPDLEALGFPTVRKKGWDYIEFEYDKVVNANQIAPRPKVVRVFKVYKQGDFSTLNIGD